MFKNICIPYSTQNVTEIYKKKKSFQTNPKRNGKHKDIVHRKSLLVTASLFQSWSEQKPEKNASPETFTNLFQFHRYDVKKKYNIEICAKQ